MVAEFVESSTETRSGFRAFETAHGSVSTLDPAMVLLDPIIQILVGAVFELAETTDDEDERARHMTFVLVGAGPTGVELAASLARMVRVTLSGNFRRIDPSKSAVVPRSTRPAESCRLLPSHCPVELHNGSRSSA